MTPSVAVFGAAGFTGALSARLVFRHPRFELRTVTTRYPRVRRVLYSASLPERWSELVGEKLIDIALGKPTSIDQIFAALER